MGKISNLIAKEFDTRLEAMLASYIMDRGYDNIRNIEDSDIAELEGNGLMTKEFVQDLVKTARHICTDFSVMDIMTWIRTECWFTPFPKMVLVRKEDVSEDFWYDVCHELNLDDEEKAVAVYMFKGEDNG